MNGFSRMLLVSHCKRVERKPLGCDVCHTAGMCYRLTGVIFDEQIEAGIFICQRCGYIKFSSLGFGDRLGIIAPERLRYILNSPVGPIIEQELREIRLEL